MNKYLSVCLLISLPFLFSSCATTGDPTQGGLFGWSEQKAVKRQDNLKQQLALSSKQAQKSRDQANKSKAYRNSLDKKIASLNAKIEKQENALARLRKKIQAYQSKYANLQHKLLLAQRHLREAKKSTYSYNAKSALLSQAETQINELRLASH